MNCKTLRKALALLLCLTMVVGIAPLAYAASGNITAVSLPLNTNYNPSTVVAPGDVWEFPLTANMFAWSEGTGGANEAVTTAQLKSAGVTIRYTIDESSIIDDVSIVTKSSSKTNNQNTAVVQVKFVKPYASTKGKDFRITLFLTYKNNRSEPSRITINGTIENPERTVSGSDSYVNIANGSVLVPTAYNKDLEIDLGKNVQIITRVYANQRYYGVADDTIYVEDDSVLRKYNSIQEIIRLTTINLNGSGNIVYMGDIGTYHAYDSAGNYLGTTANKLPYSTKYYLASEKIDMSGTDLSASTSSSAGSGSSSSSSSSSGSGSTTTTTGGATISTSTAKTQMETAISAAKSSGTTTATVRFKDAGAISGEALRTMNTTAVNANMKPKMVADTMNGNSVVGRLTINPSLATNISGNVQLGAYVSDTQVKSTRDKFTRWYSNKVAVVALAQNGSYGMPVTVAAKVSLAGMNTQNLYFYSYDKSTNQYTQVTATGYYVDSSNYLHFTTSLGNDMVISDGPLKLK